MTDNMRKNIPLSIEVLSGKESEEHRIATPKAIASILHAVAEHGNHVALYYGDIQQSMLTLLLNANSSGVWMEQSQTESVNRGILASKKVTFVSSDQQVKVQFSAGHVKEVTYQGDSAFFLPLPESIYRLQRREYFRLPAPPNFICAIPTDPDDGVPLYEAHIMDISGGGIGLDSVEDDPVLTIGRTFTNCKIDLPEIGTITVSITVKNQVTLGTKPNRVVRKRAGCEFNNLSNATANQLQRYISNLQRELLNR